MGNVELPKKLTLLPASRFATQILLYERRVNLRRRNLDHESTRTTDGPPKEDQSGYWKRTNRISTSERLDHRSPRQDDKPWFVRLLLESLGECQGDNHVAASQHSPAVSLGAEAVWSSNAFKDAKTRS